MIRDESKKIAQLKDIIKIDDLNYNSKCGKTYNFAKYSLPIAFPRDIHEGYLSLENVIFSKVILLLKNIKKHLKKNRILSKLGLFFSAREEVLNSFKSKMFPIKKIR